MCGRYTLRTSPAEIAAIFSLLREPDLTPRYNISPGQTVAAIRFDPERSPHELVPLKWGLVPSWAKDPKIGYRTINARGDTVATKPSFRAAFKRRRCLIPADGFFEWKKLDAKHKQPYYITQRDGRPFAFAGLYEHWSGPDGTPLDTCTIITTEANEPMSAVHDRMPVILAAEDYDRWIDPSQDPGELQALIRPAPDDLLKFTPVSTLVNNPRNDRAECIQPLAEDATRDSLFGDE
jgi:putative SOS response-associated peptidase YedK